MTNSHNNITCPKCHSAFSINKSDYALISEQVRTKEFNTELEKKVQSELSKLYKTCKFFVFPSLIESFGNPLVEAMASGAPIATSNKAAMPEIVGSAALLFDPTRISEMTNALQRLYEDEELRYSLSVKSLQRSQIFSWSKTADATLKAIKNVAAKSRK